MKKVFFAGHKVFYYDRDIFQRYKDLLIELIKDGATDFYAGGAQGWDMMFEKTVLALRDDHIPFIKLHLVLPCPPDEQSAKWNSYDKETFREILDAADSVEILSEHYHKNCIRERNVRLAELGDVCVCCYNEKQRRSHTAQAVQIAEKYGKKIINVMNLQ